MLPSLLYFISKSSLFYLRTHSDAPASVTHCCTTNRSKIVASQKATSCDYFLGLLSWPGPASWVFIRVSSTVSAECPPRALSPGHPGWLTHVVGPWCYWVGAQLAFFHVPLPMAWASHSKAGELQEPVSTKQILPETQTKTARDSHSAASAELYQWSVSESQHRLQGKFFHTAGRQRGIAHCGPFLKSNPTQ